MHYFEFAMLCFTSLFTMFNPLGVVPVFNSMTLGIEQKITRKIAFKASATTAITLILFAIAGKAIFLFFSISTDSFRVAGGVLFFLMGYDMLQARISRTRDDLTEAQEKKYAGDIAITPLAIPMICGPGAITNVIILMQDSSTWMHRGVLFAVIAVVSGLTYIIIISGKSITRFLGDDGNKVIMRLMGLIVMVIAVESFFAGIKPFLRGIFNIP